MLLVSCFCCYSWELTALSTGKTPHYKDLACIYLATNCLASHISHFLPKAQLKQFCVELFPKPVAGKKYTTHYIGFAWPDFGTAGAMCIYIKIPDSVYLKNFVPWLF